jgi:hypothetical protein
VSERLLFCIESRRIRRRSLVARPAIWDRVGRLAEARDDASPVLVVPRTSTQRA